MTYGNVNVDTVTTSTPQGVLGAGNASIMKNRIINGAMVIDQRNAGASVTVLTSTGYTLDRWKTSCDVSSKFSVQQNAGSVTPPIGFVNYLGVTSLSAYSVPSGEIYGLQHHIEGYNTADLQWGTANAKTVTLSFWVRSSLTGTFGGSFLNATSDRSYPFTYTISSANTWTQISITVAGDTSGTWNTTNGRGIVVIFSLGTGTTYSGTAGSWSANNYQSATGATSVVGTSGATFYITGVQLEVGSSATGFEYVNYQTSLANCQRYYQNQPSSTNGYARYGMGLFSTSSLADFQIRAIVQMRTAPSWTTSGSFRANSNSAYTISSFGDRNQPNTWGIALYGNISGATAGYAASLEANNDVNAYIALSAEL